MMLHKHISLESLYYSMREQFARAYYFLNKKSPKTHLNPTNDELYNKSSETEKTYNVTLNAQLDSLTTLLDNEKLTKDVTHLRIEVSMNHRRHKWENFSVLAKHLVTLDLSNLTSLTISCLGMYPGNGTEGAKILSQSNQLANLIELQLFSVGAGDEGMTALAQSPYLTKLTNLYLHEHLSNEGVKALTQFSNLTSLSLSDNILICDNKIGNDSIIALSQNLKLRELDLCGHFVDDNIAENLALLSNLTSFSLSGSKIGNKTAKVLARLPHLKYITCLSGSMIGNEGARALAQSPSLSHLMLEGSMVGNDGLIALASSSNLNRLFLGDTIIDMDGIKSLATLPRLPKSINVSVKKKRSLMARIFRWTPFDWSEEAQSYSKYAHMHSTRETLRDYAKKISKQENYTTD